LETQGEIVNKINEIGGDEGELSSESCRTPGNCCNHKVCNPFEQGLLESQHGSNGYYFTSNIGR